MKIRVDMSLEIEVDGRIKKENFIKVVERFVDYTINNSTYVEIGLPERNIVLDPVHAELSAVRVRRLYD